MLTLDCDHEKTDCLKYEISNFSNGRFSLILDRTRSTARNYSFYVFDTFSNKTG